MVSIDGTQLDKVRCRTATGTCAQATLRLSALGCVAALTFSVHGQKCCVWSTHPLKRDSTVEAYTEQHKGRLLNFSQVDKSFRAGLRLTMAFLPADAS